MGDSYKKFALSYDKSWAEYNRITITKTLEYLPESLHNARILDYGCGTGELIIQTVNRFPTLRQVVGFDPSESMLAIAKGKLTTLNSAQSEKTILISDEYELISNPQSFDLIILTNVFHYLPNPQHTLQMLRKLLKEGGIVILQDYSKDGLLAKYFEWFIRIIDKIHVKAYLLDGIKETIEKSGFHVLKSEEFKISPLWIGWILKFNKK